MTLEKAITKEKAASFVMERLKEATYAGNSYYTNNVIQQIRGVIWLLTDKDPGSDISSIAICKLFDIPYRVDGEFVYWGDKV